MQPAQGEYILGHAEDELDRLIGQSRFFGDLTEHLFRLAGLAPGMRVLDVGCGAGDVSFLAARIAGPSGFVTGIDRAKESVALASRRAADAGIRNVEFVVGDAATFTLDQPVDAAVGRLVLLYCSDPAAIVRHVATLVRPGGIVTFQDFDMEAPTSEPRCPLFDSTLQKVRDAFRSGGAEIRMGLKLGRIFEDAGLPSPRMRLGARVERGPDSDAYEQLARIARTLLPVMERAGIATKEEMAIDTLASRLRDEAVALRATVVSPTLIGAWTTTQPGRQPR
jgi:SAM-dependent methyltransferase